MKKVEFNLEKYFKKYSYDTNKVVGIDPSDFDNNYILENGILSKIPKKEIKKEHLLATYIPNNIVITYEFKIQKNLLEKIDLDDFIETKCYEDVGLDKVETYIFKYKLIYGLEEDKELSVEVVIIPEKALKEHVEPITSKYGYLDYITYSGYVFNALYQEEILEPQNDLYIYFSKTEIFITLYSEGKFLQTSIIPEGLESIYETLKETINIKDFNFDLFIKLLITKGLDAGNYNEKEHTFFNELSELFSNKFLIISNQIHLIVRKFSLTTVDRIFMSTNKGSIPGISEFANMYLGVESNDLKFDSHYNPNNIEIDQILFLAMLSAKSDYKKESLEDNINLFKRPPTFFYRKSGQLITITVTSIILSLLYPTYQMISTYFINSQNEVLQAKLDKLTTTNHKYSKLNKKLKNTLKQKKDQKTAILNYIKDIETIIDTIYKEKKGYVPKSLIISLLSKYLNSNNVFLNKLSYEDKFLILDVYASKDKDITKFIDDIIKKEHMIVSTDGYKKVNNFYQAKISIKVDK